jgi:hypothetical protein
VSAPRRVIEVHRRLLQDQWFPETAGAWGEARPECPGHTHHAEPGIRHDVAVWSCPKDGRVLARIGEL